MRRDAQRLVDAVFVLVVVLTLLQGTTLPFVARRLGVVAPASRRRSRSTPPRWTSCGADLLQVRVPAGSRLRGVYLRELRLPRGATVSLVVRDERGVHPGGDTRLRVGRPAARRHHGRGRAARPSGGSGRSTARAAGPLARGVRRD